MGKLSASSRQNAMAAALKEYSVILRTVYPARYLFGEACRRRIARQLDKRESLHALRRELRYAPAAPSTARTSPGRVSRHGA
ncbi:Tn3 family transposase [Nonomuraea sp. NPDC050227]|uniref:Tn3 family transposase n=1 Tax=unclassified Nonomuraea TaxID=2593643 RepID=UPI0036A4F300